METQRKQFSLNYWWLLEFNVIVLGKVTHCSSQAKGEMGAQHNILLGDRESSWWWITLRPGIAEQHHEMPEGGPQGPLPLIPGDSASMKRSKVTVICESHITHISTQIHGSMICVALHRNKVKCVILIQHSWERKIQLRAQVWPSMKRPVVIRLLASR